MSQNGEGAECMEKGLQKATSSSATPEMRMVSLAKCEDYGRERVFAAVSRTIELMVGIE